MSENNANDKPWVEMNEITSDDCVDDETDVQSRSSDSLIDDVGSTSDDQTMGEEVVSGKKNEATPQSASEASISPHASTGPVVCRCSCTRIPKSSPVDEKDIVRLSESSGNHGLASSPDSQVMLSAGSPKSHNLRSLNDLEPWSVPRTFGFESPAAIQDWSRKYQSDEDTASEEGESGYAFSNSDAGGPRDRRPSGGE